MFAKLEAFEIVIDPPNLLLLRSRFWRLGLMIIESPVKEFLLRLRLRRLEIFKMLVEVMEPDSLESPKEICLREVVKLAGIVVERGLELKSNFSRPFSCVTLGRFVPLN